MFLDPRNESSGSEGGNILISIVNSLPSHKATAFSRASTAQKDTSFAALRFILPSL